MNMIPKTVTFSGEELSEMKARGLSEKLRAELKSSADKWLDSPLYAVTERMMRAESGNPHDYMQS